MTSLFHAPGHFRFPLAVQNTGNIFLDYLRIRPHCAQSGNGEECRHLEQPNTLPAYMVSRPVLLVSTTPCTNYQYDLASSSVVLPRHNISQLLQRTSFQLRHLEAMHTIYCLLVDIIFICGTLFETRHKPLL